MRSFEQLIKWLDHENATLPVTEWVKMFPAGIPEGERLLLSDTSRILNDLKSAPPEVRGPIMDLVRSMAAGMRHFATLRAAGRGRLELKGIKEVNQYCFFVAGIVGEALSKLLVAVDADVRLTKSVLVDAHHFGLFLQKVNILKDQVQDENEGRFLVSSREELYSSLGDHAEGAMRYIEAVPVARRDYRVFCAWSLFLGLATLPVLRAAVAGTAAAPNKIARAETAEIFSRVELVIGDEKSLRSEFARLMSSLKPFSRSTTPDTTTDVATLGLPQWIRDSYAGPLTGSELHNLGLI
jgi:Squalene/phytoene synthase